MKLWLEYHGLGLVLVGLALATFALSIWVEAAFFMGIVLAFTGILRACDGQRAHQEHLRESEQAFSTFRRHGERRGA